MFDNISSLLSINSLLIISLLGVLSVLYFLQKKKSGIPGPFGWPIIGHFFAFGKNSRSYLEQMGKKYGDVFQIQLGCQDFVVFNGYIANKETINDMPNIFAGRPDVYTSRLIYKEGINFFGDWDDLMRKRRKGLVKALASTATTRSENFQQAVHEAKDNLINALKQKYDKKFVNPEKDLIQMMGHVMFNVLFGSLSPDAYHEDNYEVLFEVNKFEIYLSDSATIDYFPWLQVFHKHQYFKWNKCLNILKEFSKKQLDKHKENNSGETPNNVVDIMFDIDKKENIFPLVAILGDVISLLEGGLETIPVMALWFLLIIGSQTHIQERLFKQIRNIVGERSITWDDCGKLPFLEACILETHRFATIVPMMFKATIQDVTYRGYNIPKGIGVITNILSIHQDKSIWEEPEKFNPNRFFKKGEEVIDPVIASKVRAFSSGSRRCPGENLAQLVIFVVLGSIFQHFKIEIDKSSENDFTDIYLSLASRPKPYTMTATLR